ncbi:MAG TPA: sigma-70 family RNA polymerase sigma factor [Trebonia sp.]|nr:sigma-70 family RNA polymerase sigma factor [Trebonia sp.]
MTAPGSTEDLLRQLAPQVLGTLVRRYGSFAECEDAVQEALLAAAVQWPAEGVPASPRSWLVSVAARRLIDQWRSDDARRNREVIAAHDLPAVAPAADQADAAARDDTLTLLFLCCQPALTEASQVALTLRAVGGLTTAQIARAFLVPETTMGQRITRAKQRLKASGARLSLESGQPAEALAAVLHVLYLIFNEGYTATSGSRLGDSELAGEAIRLTRAVRRLLPDDGEVAGLLALMLLTDARRAARTRGDGALIPLAEQDRDRWDAAAISEGTELITHALATAPIGPYQLEAAIAAVHDEAAIAADTDWPQILALYRLLERIKPSPVVRLNLAVAAAMVHGPLAGLDLLSSLDADERMAGYHRVAAVRGHLLEMAGEHDAARASYLLAARRTTSLPERRYLESRAARCPG